MLSSVVSMSWTPREAPPFGSGSIVTVEGTQLERLRLSKAVPMSDTSGGDQGASFGCVGDVPEELSLRPSTSR